MNLNNIFPQDIRKLNTIRDFEHMAKLPPAAGLKKASAKFGSGHENTWYEYVPGSYKGDRKVPLIVQIHGGGNDGRRWADYTIWHLLAEEHGFIVIYPNSQTPERWNCDEDDIEYVAKLIAHIKGKYSIDESRVYMQGMSNGEMMTLAFTMVHPELLAAAGNMTGPSPAEMIGTERPAGALPLIQMRGEKDIFFQFPDEPPKDIYEKRYSMNDINREIWREVNGTADLPVLTINGKDNFLVFKGNAAPIINWEIKNMGHREPADGAQVLWDLLYSKCSRVNGKLVIDALDSSLKGDDDGAAIAIGSNKVFIKDHTEAMHDSDHGYARYIAPPKSSSHFGKFEVDEMFETRGFYIPAEGLKAIFGAKVTMVDPGDSAIVETPDGNTYQFYSNSLLVKHNDKYTAMRKPCELIAGIFLVPIDEIAGDLLGKFVSVAADVMYIANHYAELGRYTARILRELLGGEQVTF